MIVNVNVVPFSPSMTKSLKSISRAVIVVTIACQQVKISLFTITSESSLLQDN